jgi:hypothetical protein
MRRSSGRRAGSTLCRRRSNSDEPSRGRAGRPRASDPGVVNNGFDVVAVGISTNAP